jgi:hypothetical protein
MLNVPFNFTFRPNFFYLPLLIPLTIIYLSRITKRNGLIILTSIIFTSNSFSSIYYGLKNAGDSYHPSKLVYEKMDITTGSKDLGDFINNYIENKDLSSYQIAYIGLGSIHLKYYLDQKGKSLELQGFASSSSGSPTIEDLKDYIFASDKSTLIVISASSLPRENELYKQFFYKSYITEAPKELSTYILRHSKIFKTIYTSNDKNSQILIYNK